MRRVGFGADSREAHSVDATLEQEEDVFAVGSDGTILHYDGTAWSAMGSGTTNDLYPTVTVCFRLIWFSNDI